MKKLALYSLIVIAVLFLSYELQSLISPAAVVGKSAVIINGRIIKVEIAKDLPAQIRGLSGRDKLESDRGLLFAFPEKRIRGFWMKNMNFPIDIIWLDNNKIVNISRDLPPAGNKPEITYSSIVPVNYVLEINAGLAEQYGFVIGDEVEFHL